MDGQAVVNCAAPILPIAHPGTVTPFGILHPGRSPGVLVFDGGFQYIAGTIVLQVESDGLGGFLTDEIIFTDGTIPDLTNVKIEFAFVGRHRSECFCRTGDWNLDTFLKTVLPDGRQPASRESRRSGT